MAGLTGVSRYHQAQLEAQTKEAADAPPEVHKPRPKPAVKKVRREYDLLDYGHFVFPR
jgi:hypothetical protein